MLKYYEHYVLFPLEPFLGFDDGYLFEFDRIDFRFFRPMVDPFHETIHGRLDSLSFHVHASIGIVSGETGDAKSVRLLFRYRSECDALYDSGDTDTVAYEFFHKSMNPINNIESI